LTAVVHGPEAYRDLTDALETVQGVLFGQLYDA
jgi:hypothetical protein